MGSNPITGILQSFVPRLAVFTSVLRRPELLQSRRRVVIVSKHFRWSQAAANSPSRVAHADRAYGGAFQSAEAAIPRALRKAPRRRFNRFTRRRIKGVGLVLSGSDDSAVHIRRQARHVPVRRRASVSVTYVCHSANSISRFSAYFALYYFSKSIHICCVPAFTARRAARIAR